DAGERLCLRNVWRNDMRERQQKLTQRPDTLIRQQPHSARGDDYRIDDEVRKRILLDLPRYHFYDLGVCQHPGFNGVRPELSDNGIDLRGDNVGGDLLHSRYAGTVLRRNSRNGGGPVDAESGERLQVRLDARPTTGVRTGNRKNGPTVSGNHAYRSPGVSPVCFA